MLRLDARRTALVLVDLQQGVVARPAAPYASADVVARGVALARAFRAARGTIVYVHVAFSADGADALKAPVDEPTPAPPGGFLADWSAFAPELAAVAPDVVIVKRHWGAFEGAELDLQLRRRGVDTVVLAGIATNFGVEFDGARGAPAQLRVVIAEGATTSFSADMHAFAVQRIFPRIARARDSAAILAALR